jgi:hypothetical protein
VLKLGLRDGDEGFRIVDRAGIFRVSRGYREVSWYGSG